MPEVWWEYGDRASTATARNQARWLLAEAGTSGPRNQVGRGFGAGVFLGYTPVPQIDIQCALVAQVSTIQSHLRHTPHIPAPFIQHTCPTHPTHPRRTPVMPRHASPCPVNPAKTCYTFIPLSARILITWSRDMRRQRASWETEV